ncbi:hypothetical protein MNBD_GAMMA12-424 [hydrothermal vent metagenome]|uniref:Uncharacterized protein n=1 Tax=hydrothermal vent metagenome TaxID=652676 RepID=A0A3B0YE76_9ZZZZ
MRLKPKVLFLIGGLAAISVASSQQSSNTILSANDPQAGSTLFWVNTGLINMPTIKTKENLSPFITTST